MWGVALTAILSVQPLAKLEPIPLPRDAQALALADMERLPKDAWPFIHYIWITDGQPGTIRAVSLAVNMVSQATVIVRPNPFGNSLCLMRVDLRNYYPRAGALEDALKTWEEFQFDPRFSLLITKGQLDLLKQIKFAGPQWVTTRRRVRVDNGWRMERKTEKREVNLKELEDADVIRIPGRHLAAAVYNRLVGMTGSQAPVISDQYFLYRSLSQIQDKGAFTILYGGLYYRLVALKKSTVDGASDEDVLFERLGIGNVKEGINAAKIFDNLRSDCRVGMFRSDVTGKPRRIDLLRSLSGAISGSTGLLIFTHDLQDQDRDTDRHALANLLTDGIDRARELIFEMPNSLHGYAAIKAQDGSFQDEVPFDVALDTTIPNPHTKRLQPAISCIRCHEADGSDGWKPLTNDVVRMTSGKRGADIFGDVSQANVTVTDTLDRLAGLYKADPERALKRGRDDYALAVHRAAGIDPTSERSQADIV